MEVQHPNNAIFSAVGQVFRRLVSPRVQGALGFHGGHAADPGGGDGLAVSAVGHVAGVEDARYAGPRAALRDHKRLRVPFELPAGCLLALGALGAVLV